MMKTHRGERIHIGIFGKRNSGKSSLLNFITGENVSIVSEILGTTTDPIYKAMEIHNLGPVRFIDTAGYDDIGEIGTLRVDKTDKVIVQCDCFIYLLSEDEDIEYIKKIIDTKKPILFIISKADIIDRHKLLEKYKHYSPILISTNNVDDKKIIIDNLVKLLGTKSTKFITSGLVKQGDNVVLVMPQDKEAPKGRLILPQVSVIRELLDLGVNAICTVPNNLQNILYELKKIDLIITDSQCFDFVFSVIPDNLRCTSFSILMSAYKGDINEFLSALDVLDSNSNIHILIAESCSHPPMDEDIGTVKIPMLLKKSYGENIKISFCRGYDFPELEDIDLIVHCGGCMLTQNQMQERIKLCKNKKVPITNYGLLLAKLNGILDKITTPNT